MEGIKINIQINGVRVIAEEYDNYIYLESIKVDKDLRNQGIGTKALKEVISHADSVNKPLLAFVSSELGGDIQRLSNWYHLHGFYKERNVIHCNYKYNFRKDPSEKIWSIEDYKVGQYYCLNNVKNTIKGDSDLLVDLSKDHQIAIRSESCMDDVVAEFYVDKDNVKCIFNIYDSDMK